MNGWKKMQHPGFDPGCFLLSAGFCYVLTISPTAGQRIVIHSVGFRITAVFHNDLVKRGTPIGLDFLPGMVIFLQIPVIFLPIEFG